MHLLPLGHAGGLHCLSMSVLVPSMDAIQQVNLKVDICSKCHKCDTFFSVTNFLLQNLVLSHVSNSVSSLYAFTAVVPSNLNASIFTVLLSPHQHIKSQNPNPISVFLFSFSFNFSKNASIFKENLPEGQIMMSHNIFRKQSADLKIDYNIYVSPLYYKTN